VLIRLSQKASLLEKARVELQNSKRQCQLMKSLLADTTAENEIMYEVSKYLSTIRPPPTRRADTGNVFLLMRGHRHLMKSLMGCSMMCTFPKRRHGPQ
jgi:hypothetical protein